MANNICILATGGKEQLHGYLGSEEGHNDGVENHLRCKANQREIEQDDWNPSSGDQQDCYNDERQDCEAVDDHNPTKH